MKITVSEGVNYSALSPNSRSLSNRVGGGVPTSQKRKLRLREVEWTEVSQGASCEARTPFLNKQVSEFP